MTADDLKHFRDLLLEANRAYFAAVEAEDAGQKEQVKRYLRDADDFLSEALSMVRGTKK